MTDETEALKIKVEHNNVFNFNEGSLAHFCCLSGVSISLSKIAMTLVRCMIKMCQFDVIDPVISKQTEHCKKALELFHDKLTKAGP